MAKINSYDVATPVSTDKLLGTDVSDTTTDTNGETANFLISAIPTVLPSHTGTAIADATDTVNTTDKVVGKCVWDTTNTRVMVASGTAATDAWYVADASTSVTPS